MAYEQTLGIIKPNATGKHVIGKIIDRYEEEGFEFGKIEFKYLSKREAEHFYLEHKERPFYQDLVKFMTSGPVVLMVLERENAINKNREVMGATNPENADPGTIRKLFGDDVEANAVHGSDSPKSAAREISFFFPDYTFTTKKAA